MRTTILLLVLLLAVPAIAQDYAENPVIVRIEKTYDYYLLGEYVELAVTFDADPYQLSGFEFMIKYLPDSPLEGVQMGPALEACGWEYFTYRIAPDMTCNGSPCPTGLVRIVALADINSEFGSPSCSQFDPGSVLFTLTFFIPDDPLFECQFFPVRFFWADCGDNFITLKGDSDLLYSVYVYDFEAAALKPLDTAHSMQRHYVTEFPTYFGTPDFCLTDSIPDGKTVHRGVTFLNGGISVLCDVSLDILGDINLNGHKWEVADAVLLLEYLVKGTEAYQINPSGQKYASDVNRDGNDYSIADFVIMAGVINGTITPPDTANDFPSLTAGYTLRNGTLSINTEAAGILVKVAGDVRPSLLDADMEMIYHYDMQDDQTTIVVYSFDQNAVVSGDVLGNIQGAIQYGELAEGNGVPVTLRKLLPESFVLYQNYPNPFNPATIIEFALPSAADYTVTITNGAGQKIEAISGSAEAGIVSIPWDGSAYASGVYFYTVEVNGTEQTKKMMLLK